ncbi:MAG: hypothetical protein QOF76_2362, partial [Solirubrobacteraceae bacterium]|nr:hypothetical protein [Solirubrobacteraceae bacterium]
MNRLRALLICLVLLAFPAAAAAATNQEATFQDDNQLLYTTPEQRDTTLDTLKGLGVDRVRLTVVWKAIAPAPKSRTKPAFAATDPNAYGAGAWA